MVTRVLKKQPSGRRPFGTSAGNAPLLRKRSAPKAGAAAEGGRQPRQQEPSPTRERGGKGHRNATESQHRDRGGGREEGRQRKASSSAALRDVDPNNAAVAARRRDSKTPKANNLSSAPGAYGLGGEFDSRRPRAKQQQGAVKKAADAPRQGRKPDPSPVKLPDPSAANDKASGRTSKLRRSGCGKKRDTFVSSSIKRLFSSSKTAEAKATDRRGDPRGASPPGRRRDASSDMDTACSTPPEKEDSPLVTSPLSKPDPVAKEDEQQDARAVTSKKKAAKDTTDDAQPKLVSKEALDRARDGPMEDKRVLHAMFNSGSRPPAPSEKGKSADSLVGSIVGGASLQRSYSADESVLTTMEGVEEDASQASMTTRAETAGVNAPHRHDPSQAKGSFDIFRSRAPARSSNNNASAADWEIRRATTVGSVPIAEHHIARANQPSSVQLPSGWKVKWSKTKQKPYYVHPDFGSTWHCPGLVSNVVHLRGQNELYDDQRVPLGMSRQQPFLSSRGQTSTARSAHSGENNDSDASKSVESMSRKVQSSHRTNESASGFESSIRGGEDEGLASRDAARNNDVSSTDASSSRLFTQDFGSDDCVASADGHAQNEEQHHSNDSVEFDGQGGGFDEVDDANLGRSDDEQPDGSDKRDPPHSDAKETQATSTNGSSVLDTIAEEQGEINSLASDHVDVDTLLRQGAKRAKSPMSTIKESCPESAGAKSSVVSPGDDDGDDDGDDLAGLKVLDADKSERSLGASSRASSGGGGDESAHDTGSAGDNQSPMFDNNGGGAFSDVDDDSVKSAGKQSSRKGDDGSVGVNLNAEFQKESKAPRPKKPKKKIFPPGPLCSLQFLEEIEHDEFDTPLWRRMKRKRSTLTSVKREKASQRQRRRGTYS